jgi:hypothetical protein
LCITYFDESSVFNGIYAFRRTPKPFRGLARSVCIVQSGLSAAELLGSSRGRLQAPQDLPDPCGLVRHVQGPNAISSLSRGREGSSKTDAGISGAKDREGDRELGTHREPAPLEIEEQFLPRL